MKNLTKKRMPCQMQRRGHDTAAPSLLFTALSPPSWHDLQLGKLSHPTGILASCSEHRAGQLRASRHRPAGLRNLS